MCVSENGGQHITRSPKRPIAAVAIMQRKNHQKKLGDTLFSDKLSAAILALATLSDIIIKL